MPIIVAQTLERSFGTTRALAGLSFSVEPGELFGLVGADGAGKTTAIRALAGLIALDGGRAEVAGHDVAAGGAVVRESLGLMPQQASLYPDLSVAETLRFFARLFCLPKQVYRERRERLLGITRLQPFVDRRADALSGGMYKKLALACALLHRPRVLLLDEPTVGVDPVSRRELWGLLHELVQEGMTVLLSTPYMDEAERCHRVALVHEGRLLLVGEPSALLDDFAARPGAPANPTFESLFLASLEAADREKRARSLPALPAGEQRGSAGEPSPGSPPKKADA